MLIELFSLGVTAEALRASIDCKSAFLKRAGHFRLSRSKGRLPPQTIFARIDRLVNVLQLCHCTHSKKFRSRLSPSQVHFRLKTAVFGPGGA